jgi:hypothetical protein
MEAAWLEVGGASAPVVLLTWLGKREQVCSHPVVGGSCSKVVDDR